MSKVGIQVRRPSPPHNSGILHSLETRTHTHTHTIINNQNISHKEHSQLLVMAKLTKRSGRWKPKFCKGFLHCSKCVQIHLLRITTVILQGVPPLSSLCPLGRHNFPVSNNSIIIYIHIYFYFLSLDFHYMRGVN